MQSMTRKTLLGLTLTGALALAACDDNNNDNGPANDPANQPVAPVALSTFVRSLFTMSTTDTAAPMEVNTIAIDSSSEDAADPNYAAILGS